ncbi:MAG: FHA domain-containing protein, partial [Woeseiaceae bacterium]
IPELVSDLRSRTKTIGQLQFDIQQLRSKWLGLEAEISAREEIASNLLRENEKLGKTIDRKNKLLKKRSASIKSLKVEIRQRDSDRLLLEQELAEQSQADNDQLKSREQAERELEQARELLERIQADHAAVQVDLQRRNDQIAELEQKFDAQQQAAEQQITDLEEARLEIDRLKAELDAAENEERNLNVEINQRDVMESTLEQKVADLEEQAIKRQLVEAGQTEQLETATQEIARLRLELETAQRQGAAQVVQTQKTTSSVVRELQAQLEKTEQYADTLRFSLNDSSESLSHALKKNDNLEDEVDRLKTGNADLNIQLESLRASNEELVAALEQLKSDHEQEIRTLRFELTEAQESVTQTSDLNSQLASDLVSTRSFKEELERMLLRNEEAGQQRVAELERQIEELARNSEEFEQKLDTKNTAINVLLGELAKKSEQIESIGEIEEVIHEIDNRISERIELPGEDSLADQGNAVVGADRDRVTRVLVGNIGEQELRFPLFKKRLTIGRTADNDIQLKTSYISRRHAVVMTEGDSTRVIDWGSKNGVYVNTERVKERFLSNGDIVAIGNAKFRYEERPKRDA